MSQALTGPTCYGKEGRWCQGLARGTLNDGDRKGVRAAEFQLQLQVVLKDHQRLWRDLCGSRGDVNQSYPNCFHSIPKYLGSILTCSCPFLTCQQMVRKDTRPFGWFLLMVPHQHKGGFSDLERPALACLREICSHIGDTHPTVLSDAARLGHLRSNSGCREDEGRPDWKDGQRQPKQGVGHTSNTSGGIFVIRSHTRSPFILKTDEMSTGRRRRTLKAKFRVSPGVLLSSATPSWVISATGNPLGFPRLHNSKDGISCCMPLCESDCSTRHAGEKIKRTASSPL